MTYCSQPCALSVQLQSENREQLVFQGRTCACHAFAGGCLHHAISAAIQQAPMHVNSLWHQLDPFLHLSLCMPASVIAHVIVTWTLYTPSSHACACDGTGGGNQDQPPPDGGGNPREAGGAFQSWSLDDSHMRHARAGRSRPAASTPICCGCRTSGCALRQALAPGQADCGGVCHAQCTGESQQLLALGSMLVIN